MKLEDILPQLTAWFPSEAHKDRKLPGGGKWFYLPHQAIRDRLNEICPADWNEELKGPFLSGNETVMICRLTICGVTREGIADNKTFPELNDDGKEKIIGSPVINAARHAFRDAAEQFGIGAYLDDQKKNRDRFVKYMQKQHDGRAYKAAYDNGWVENGNGEAVKPRPRQPENTDILGVMDDKKGAVISEAQIKRLWAIARSKNYTDEGVKALIQSYGYSSSRDIKVKDYDSICSKSGDANLAQIYNSKATTSV